MSKDFLLQVVNEDLPIESGNVNYLETHHFPNGKPFPKSYIDFAKQYGYGLTAGLYLIYIPMDNYCDSWQQQSSVMRSVFDKTIKEEIYIDFEPDGNLDLMKKAVPFGRSENGDFLFWDIYSNSEVNEFDIYITDFKGIGAIKIASNLYDFVYKMTHINEFPLLKSALFKREVAPAIFKRFIRIDIH